MTIQALSFDLLDYTTSTAYRICWAVFLNAGLHAKMADASENCIEILKNAVLPEAIYSIYTLACKSNLHLGLFQASEHGYRVF